MATLELLIGAAVLAAPLGLIASTGLRYTSSQPRLEATLVDRIDALLPQTQCGQCGHPGCRPYAEAIASGEPFNRCPPGREHTVAALAELLHESPRPLDIDGPSKPRAVAFIREAECIGCTKCIQACPVDAILGSAKLMHTVIAAECTGCDLCVEPCPVDCIDLLPLPAEKQNIAATEAAYFRTRFHAHNARLERDLAEQEQRRAQRKSAAAIDVFTPFAAPVDSETITPEIEQPTAETATTDKQSEIQAAIARTKAKKATGAAPTASEDLPASSKQVEIQAAIARAKAKKANISVTATDEAAPVSGKQAEIQAAIARAKEKKANIAAPATGEAAPVSGKQAEIQAAIARTKAKKANAPTPTYDAVRSTSDKQTETQAAPRSDDDREPQP